jgi:hypothetical protein
MSETEALTAEEISSIVGIVPELEAETIFAKIALEENSRCIDHLAAYYESASREKNAIHLLSKKTQNGECETSEEDELFFYRADCVEVIHRMSMVSEAYKTVNDLVFTLEQAAVDAGDDIDPGFLDEYMAPIMAIIELTYECTIQSLGMDFDEEERAFIISVANDTIANNGIIPVGTGLEEI